MNQPRRFKTAAKLGHEGRLIAVGSSEMPDTEAVHRVAHRLGVSAAALATAAVATASTASATATTTTVGSGGTGTAIGKATGSLLSLSTVKAATTGVGLGLALFAGAQWVRSGSPASTSPSLTADSKTQNRVQASPRGPSAVPAGSVAEYPKPATLPRQTISVSLSSAREATVTEDRAAIDGAPLSASIGRFDDLEPPTTLTARNSNPKDSLSSQTPEAAATPGHQVVAVPEDPRLAREVASLDRARSTAHRGDANGALRELDGFERKSGFVALRKEAMLVRIDVLLSLARQAEAAATARQLLLMGAPVNQRTRLEALLREQH
jgi:hypothetical protein